MRNLACLLSLLTVLGLAGCATAPTDVTSRGEGGQVAALAAAIRDLGPGVDAEEAARAARISYTHTDRLARAYRITDPPLIHNMKVNMGLRPRGLCWHWAHDMEKRLAREGFETLELHRAVANADNPFRLEHSTVIVSRRGDSLWQGIVLDPWREGGTLHWTPVQADTRFDWRPRHEILTKRLGKGWQNRVRIAPAGG
jgi:hypothetical protein